MEASNYPLKEKNDGKDNFSYQKLWEEQEREEDEINYNKNAHRFDEQGEW